MKNIIPIIMILWILSWPYNFYTQLFCISINFLALLFSIWVDRRNEYEDIADEIIKEFKSRGIL